MPLTPTAAQVISDAISSRLLDHHSCIPGRVKSYDRAKQTAEIVPVTRGVIGTEAGDILLEDLPVLPNVPVCWMRGGGYSLQFPLNEGDHGLVIFSESSPAQWRVSGDTSDPGDLRRNDLSFGFFIPCCAPDAKTLPELAGGPLPTDPANEAAIDLAGPLRIGGPSADFVALSAKVDAAISALASFEAAVQATLTGGIGTPNGPGTFTTPLTATAPSPASTAATKVKAE